MSSAGKSGSFFYRTADKKFILKSVDAKEFLFFCSILSSYVAHLSAHPDSLLIRFLSLFTLRYPFYPPNTPSNSQQPPTKKEIHFVVMNNLTPPESEEIIERFDLKGSFQGRQATAEEKEHSSVILKDLDWDRKLFLAFQTQEKLQAQLALDCRWLCYHHIMDYSLLLFITSSRPSSGPSSSSSLFSTSLGVAPSSSSSSPSLSSSRVSYFMKDGGGIQAEDGKGGYLCERYYLGIIDILQAYNLRKKVEHKLKSFAWHEDDVSCMDPERYAMRLETFVMRMMP